MWYNEFNIRNKTIFHIQYVIITKRYDKVSIFPPREFDNSFIFIIKFLPKSLLQLDGKTTEYIVGEWSNYNHTGYDLSIIYEENFLKHIALINNYQLTVLFIDESIENISYILDQFKRNNILFYVYSKEKVLPSSFSNAFELINLIKSDKTTINNHFDKLGFPTNFAFQYNIPDTFKEQNRYKYFTPSMANFLMLNQYIGNLWHDDQYVTEITDSFETNEHEQITKASTQTSRVKIISNQTNFIDHFGITLKNAYSSPGTFGDMTPFFTPLILCVPYQFAKPEVFFPGFEKIEKFKIIKELFRVEQELDYRNYFNVTDKDETEVLNTAKLTLPIVQKNMRYLDDMAYLHASFTFSPIIRLPLKGKSLSGFLSLFNPDRPLPSKEKFFKAVNNFGNAYVEASMSEELKNHLAQQNRQLVCISDLPVEWFNVENVPLCFTHDITRLPQLPYGGLMSLYVKNASLEYRISENVIENVLVIFGAPINESKNKHFKIGYSSVEEQSKKLKFKVAYCNNIEELKNAVEFYKPAILIFDTHGKTVKEERTTLLQIGNEWLTGEAIIQNKISAPIVILSACNTVPNWGYLNPITNAFFEAGAISITGTFLPISIIGGTIFYQRILNNLSFASPRGLHPNWLNFISHNIRSHYIHEILMFVRKKIDSLHTKSHNKAVLREKLEKIGTDLMGEAMSFSKRRNLFNEIKERFTSLHPQINIDLNMLSLEQLLYSNLGRGDLILFESWIKKEAASKSKVTSSTSEVAL